MKTVRRTNNKEGMALKNTMASTVAVLVMIVSSAVGAAAKAEVDLVPWPKSVETKSGSLELTGKSRIVATDASLLPLAKLLSEEILQTTGRQLAAAQGEAAKGDIVLNLDPRLRVADSPDYNLRGIQVCIKHQPHTLGQVKQTIQMCRLYKIRYYMPHMSMW